MSVRTAVRKGLAKATRVTTARRRTVEVLTREAEEELFRAAEVMVEGAPSDGTYYASVMITVPIVRLEARWRGRLDPSGRQKLCELARGSVRVRLRAMRLAREEVTARLSGHRLGTATVETRVTVSESALHLDLDLEIPIQQIAHG